MDGHAIKTKTKYMTEQHLHEARIIIAGALKNRRIELSLTQEEVANRTGMARATINRLEQGLFWPGLKQFLIVCAALHLSPSLSKLDSSSAPSAIHISKAEF